MRDDHATPSIPRQLRAQSGKSKGVQKRPWATDYSSRSHPAIVLSAPMMDCLRYIATAGDFLDCQGPFTARIDWNRGFGCTIFATICIIAFALSACYSASNYSAAIAAPLVFVCSTTAEDDVIFFTCQQVRVRLVRFQTTLNRCRIRQSQCKTASKRPPVCKCNALKGNCGPLTCARLEQVIVYTYADNGRPGERSPVSTTN